MSVKLSADMRRKVVIKGMATAIKAAKSPFVTKSAVANACEIPTSRHTVHHYFTNIDTLRDEARASDPAVERICKKAGV